MIFAASVVALAVLVTDVSARRRTRTYYRVRRTRVVEPPVLREPTIRVIVPVVNPNTFQERLGPFVKGNRLVP